MKERKVTLEELNQGIKLATGEEYRLVLDQPKAYRLEIVDAFFQTASAVFLPDVPLALESAGGTADAVAFSNEGLWKALSESHKPFAENLKSQSYDPSTSDPPRLAGAILFLTVLRFLRQNQQHKLLITGHTDRAADAAYNQRLSEARATSTLAVLTGDRETFVKTCKKYHVADDDAVFVRYAARTRGWPCDLDGDQKASAQEIRRFQQAYNEAFGAHIAVDGVVGGETLGAYHDLLEDDLRSGAGGEDQLKALRGELRYVDDAHPWIGFGEQYPVDPSEPDGTRCQNDRRVELLLFEPPLLPALSDSKHAGQEIYRDKRYQFTPLRADGIELSPGGGQAGEFVLVDAEAPAPGVGEPEEELATTMDVVDSARDPSDAWAFLEPLDDARTQQGDWTGGTDAGGTAVV